MSNATMPSQAVGSDHRMSSDGYAWIVARLSDRWRVIECPDGIQWIIQSGRRNGGEMRWYNELFCRSLVGLLLHVGELARREGIEITPAARQLLTSLPDWIEAPRSRIREEAGRKELVAEAA